jgi:hypothetical protein
MYVNDNHFDGWIEKLFGAIREMGKDLKSLIHTNDICHAFQILFPIRTMQVD